MSRTPMLYPLVFHPLLKERLWGGRNLERLYQKAVPPGMTVGESWEIADRADSQSVIANGPLAGKELRWLMERHPDSLMGSAKSQRGRFPLLVKILDAQDTLSVQVHPPPAIAAALGGEPKTEMWYVAQAAADALLYVGLRPGVTRACFEDRLRRDDIEACLHKVRVSKGDAMFLPSGRLHALGAGNVIFEIQQNSDTTYRVFDWRRVDRDGKPRSLHITESLACIDFDDHEPGLIQARAWSEEGGGCARTLVDHALFRVVECVCDADGLHSQRRSGVPQVVGMIRGRLAVEDNVSGETVWLSPGQFCLVPASVSAAQLRFGCDPQEKAVCLVVTPGA